MRGLFTTIAITALGALAVPACGGGSPTQMEARDQATTTSCDFYQRCDKIGSSKQYSTRDDCETQVKATFQSAWPPEGCTNISPTGLGNCETAIRIADCTSGIDALSVLSKCSRMNVCGTP